MAWKRDRALEVWDCKVLRPNFEGLCSAEFIVFPQSEHFEAAYLQYFLYSSSFVAAIEEHLCRLGAALAGLFGKARQRVLALLFGAPDRRLFLREIARLAGTGLGSVQREVARLTEAGLLSREREGRQTYYRANPDSRVANELRDLMRKTAGAAGVIYESLGVLRASVRVAAIFGSFAEGTERPGSDVDVLVIGDVTFNEVVDALTPAERAIGREINPAVFSPSEYAGKLREGNHFLASLDARSKVYLIGDDHELAGLARERMAGTPRREPTGGAGSAERHRARPRR